MICKRVKCGLHNARANGRRIERPAARAALISKARAVVARGHSLRSASKLLGLSVATIHKYSNLAEAVE
jgi:DNA invertase Pin-like site-specific DNA recombinase